MIGDAVLREFDDSKAWRSGHTLIASTLMQNQHSRIRVVRFDLLAPLRDNDLDCVIAHTAFHEHIFH